MGSNDSTNVYSKIASLEDKVNRLEEIINFGSRGDLNSYSYYNEGPPPHYRSAIRLTKATQNFKQDLIENPRYNRLSRENYEEIYDRVSALEKELNSIVRNMNVDRSGRSDSSYYLNGKSRSYYDNSYSRDYNSRPKRRTIREPLSSQSYYDDSYSRSYNSQHKGHNVREPRRKRVSYDRYVELIPSDSCSCSSESVKEIIYYLDSSTTSSTSSSVIVEEYVPKRYTRRPVRRGPPIVDVSKSRPKQSEEEPRPQPRERKSKTRRKRRYPPHVHITKTTKDRKSKKEKNRVEEEESDSETDVPVTNEKSEIFLVKKSKESPKDSMKTKSKEKRDKYFVSRLKKVDSPENGENTARGSSELKPREEQRKDSKFEKRTSRHKGSGRRNMDEGSGMKLAKSKKRDKKEAKRKPLSPEQSTETITVAQGSFILNDPFVRTIYYDDIDSLGDNKSSNNENSNYHKKSESVVKNMLQSNNTVSVYEMCNSIYSFDPYLNRKEKLYPKELDVHDLSRNADKNKSRIHNVNKNDIIVLNDDNIKPHQQKFTFKQRKIPRNVNGSFPDENKEKNGLTDKRSYVDEDRNSMRASSPTAHSVYLTTVPIYQSGFQDLPASSPKNSRYEGQPNSKQNHISLNLEKSVIEDEIALNVAKKLSPVVAEIISTKYLKEKDKFKTQSEYSIPNSNIDCSSDIHLSARNRTTVYYNVSSGDQNLSPQNKDIQSTIPGKMCNKSKSSENEIFIEVNNPTQRNRNTQVYFSTLEDDSPLQRGSMIAQQQSSMIAQQQGSMIAQQQEPSNTKKSALKKKMKTISSVSRLFSKGIKKESSHHSLEVPLPEAMIQQRESFAALQRDSQIQQRGSEISLKQQVGSWINQNQLQSSHINEQPRSSMIAQKQRGSTINQQKPKGSMIAQQRGSTIAQQRGSMVAQKPQGSMINQQKQQRSMIAQQPGSMIAQQGSTIAQQRGSMIAQKPKGSMINQQKQQSSMIAQQPGSMIAQRGSTIAQQRGSMVAKKSRGSMINHQKQQSSMIAQQPGSMIAQRGSTIAQQRGSMISQKQRGSMISLTPRASMIGQQKQGSRISLQPNIVIDGRRISSEEEEGILAQLVPLASSPSLSSRAQSIQPKKSRSFFGSKKSSDKLQTKKKSGSQLKNIFKKSTSQEKIQKKSKEPRLISILNKMKSEKKSSKVLKQESQEQMPEQTEGYSVMKVGNRATDYFSPSQIQQLRNQSKINPGQDYDQGSSTEGFVKDIEAKLGAPYIDPEMNRLDEKSDSEIIYSGSREYLKKIRSVSGYDWGKKETVEDGDMERKESVVSERMLYQPGNEGDMLVSQLPLYQPGNEGDMLVSQLPLYQPDDEGDVVPQWRPYQPDNEVEIIKKDNFDGEVYPEINALNQPFQENTLIQDSPMTNKELNSPCEPMKQLEFCIHFSKEKRTKFESQSIASLDHILASECKKVYSSEDISLSEYAYDHNTESYKYRKIYPKQPKGRCHVKCPAFKRQDSNNDDYSSESVFSKNNCCKNGMFTKSEQLISDSCTTLDWHKVANEIKQAQ